MNYQQKEIKISSFKYSPIGRDWYEFKYCLRLKNIFFGSYS